MLGFFIYVVFRVTSEDIVILMMYIDVYIKMEEKSRQLSGTVIFFHFFTSNSIKQQRNDCKGKGIAGKDGNRQKEIFTDLNIWAEIRKVIDRINANTVA